MHTEKQKIFDDYAKSQQFEDWNDLMQFMLENDMDVKEHVFEACDLVQKAQQDRIAKAAKLHMVVAGQKNIPTITRSAYISDSSCEVKVDETSITSENNLIK